jgi:hypothetical protein
MVLLWSEEGYVVQANYRINILDCEKGKTNILPQLFSLFVKL